MSAPFSAPTVSLLARPGPVLLALACAAALAAAVGARAEVAGGASELPALPAPLPAPGDAPAAAPEGLDDPLDALWGHRLVLGPGGAPLVTIRLLEGEAELAVAARSRARVRLRARGGPAVEIPAGEPLRVRAREALPAAIAYHALLGEAPYGERAGLARARRLWEERGVAVVQRVTGGVYGMAGRVVDTRRAALLAAGDGSEAGARAFAEESLARFGGRTGVFAEVVRRPSGRIEVEGPGGLLARGDGLVVLDLEGDGEFLLRGGAGPAADGRAYRGRLYLTLDASGRLAAVLGVALEELLRGLVPSEIPAGAPAEALKAQAVTARSNVLAQMGTRHLTEPWALCSDVHCQAYRGAGVHAAATDSAVRATAGEALFGRADRTLVDGVYSALCGGHGEDNDAVWPAPPDLSLRGRPDLPADAGRRWAGGLRDDRALRAFLAERPASFCARAGGVPRDRLRWERRLGGPELDAVARALGLPRVRGLNVEARGASGRARALAVEGDGGRAIVEGELRIRKLLGNLPSSMFLVDRDGEALVLRGGGWGHGVGMCQWGAIGRAEAGQDYRAILRAYFAGAEVAKVY